jgi:hypothetical protein
MTPDGRYLIKSIPLPEYQAMERLIYRYFYHHKIFNNSFIAKITGVFSLRHKGGAPMFFMIMRNAFPKEPKMTGEFRLFCND